MGTGSCARRPLSCGHRQNPILMHHGQRLFHLGLDGDSARVFDESLSLVKDSGLYEVQITFLTPFPGTPLYRGSSKRAG